MATRASIVDFLVDQLGPQVSARPMFGEYGVYRAGTLIGLVCDDRLFLKPNPAARALLAAGGEVEEGSPYPGAKPQLVVSEERWDDAELMRGLARATGEAMALAPERAPRRAGK